VTLNLSEGHPAEKKAHPGTATLGERLRHAREARGLTLRDISDETRISLRHLEAIENDDYAKLPGGIFNRSFIKAYARTVGFDEREAVELYLQAAREQGLSMEDVPPLRTPTVYTDGQTTQSPLATILLSVAILAILSLGVYAVLHWYQRRTTATVKPQVQPTPSVAPTPQASPSQTPFTIEVRARSEPVWIRARIDEAETFEAILQPNESKDFTPKRDLRIEFSRSKIGAFDVLINGQPYQSTPKIEGGLASIAIARADRPQ
jgi:cytoskeleton protein RodZ